MKAYFRKIQFYLFLATVASIPFPVAFNRNVVYALSAVTLLACDWSTLKENLKQKKRILLAGSVAVLNLLGMAYTSNVHDGFSLVERSAITLIIPVIILLVTPTKKQVNIILYFFVTVCLLVCFYCVLYSFYRIYQAGSFINAEKISDRPYYFFINNELTSKAMRISPIYLGLYINFCIAFLLVKVFMQKESWKGNFILLIVFHFFQALIFSLSAVLALFALWMIVLFKLASDKTVVQRMSILFTFFVVIGICFLGIYSIKPLHDRIFVKPEYHFENAHVSYWSGVTLRLGVWECAAEAVAEAPIIGHGTGDADDVMVAKYKERRFLLAEYMQLNAHNQYMQSYLMHGIIGIAVIFSVLLFPFYFAVKEGNWLLIMFLVILFLGFLTEVLFDVQKGLVFFSVFFPILYLPHTEKE